MPDILHDFPINASAAAVFRSVSTPEGIDRWWAKRSTGTPAEGSTYELAFGPGYQWQARVTRCVTSRVFELEMVRADDDWIGTRVGFELDSAGSVTRTRFHHTGWRDWNEHYRISCYCWAMYLRILKRNLEFGETVPYEIRLEA